MSGPILIIDDYDDARAALREILEPAGYEVIEASSGRNALHYLTSDKPPPALILLDLEMPDINGWDLVKILQSYLRLSAIPIVVASGTKSPEQPRRGQIVRFLRKPVDPALLLSAVQAYVAPPVAKPGQTSVKESVH